MQKSGLRATIVQKNAQSLKSDFAARYKSQSVSESAESVSFSLVPAAILILLTRVFPVVEQEHPTEPGALHI